MGNKPLSYRDAATLLGAQSPALAAVSKLAGAGLTVASAGGADAALSLFNLKDESNAWARTRYGACAPNQKA